MAEPINLPAPPQTLLETVWNQLETADQHRLLHWMVERVRLAPSPVLPEPAPAPSPRPKVRTPLPPSSPSSPSPSSTASSPSSASIPKKNAPLAAPPPTKTLWSIRDVAHQWGISPSTVWRYIKLGQLPAFRLYDKYIIPSDVVDGTPIAPDTRAQWMHSEYSSMRPAVEPTTPAWLDWMAGTAQPFAPRAVTQAR